MGHNRLEYIFCESWMTMETPKSTSILIDVHTLDKTGAGGNFKFLKDKGNAMNTTNREISSPIENDGWKKATVGPTLNGASPHSAPWPLWMIIINRCLSANKLI